MFDAASALLAVEGVSVRRHSAVHAAIGERFVRTGRVDTSLHRGPRTAFDLRQVADCDPMVSISIDAARSIRSMMRTTSSLPRGDTW